MPPPLAKRAEPRFRRSPLPAAPASPSRSSSPARSARSAATPSSQRLGNRRDRPLRRASQALGRPPGHRLRPALDPPRPARRHRQSRTHLSINEDGSYADIAHIEASQITGFADSARGTYLSTANTGKLSLLSHDDAPQGTYLSDVFDAGVFSQWGRAEVDTSSGPATASSKFDLYARAGNIENPARAWSDWKKITPNVGTIGIGSARFVQWKAVLRPGADITSVGVNYLPVNVAPAVDEIVVEPGARVNAAPAQSTQTHPVAINFPTQQTASGITIAQQPGHSPLIGIRDKSDVTLRWLAHDENSDTLTYSVYYRGEGEHNWQLLRKNISQTFLTFDAELLPDGPYRLKVVASDAPSHNPGEALTGERTANASSSTQRRPSSAA